MIDKNNWNNFLNELEDLKKYFPTYESPDIIDKEIIHKISQTNHKFSFQFFVLPKFLIPAITTILIIIGFFIINDKENCKKNLNENETVTVKFKIKINNAKTVSLIGDFNGWDINSTKLSKNNDDLWTVSLRLKPGRYQYLFVIDKEKYIPDTQRKEYTVDGYGNKNSVIEVTDFFNSG